MYTITLLFNSLHIFPSDNEAIIIRLDSSKSQYKMFYSH